MFDSERHCSIFGYIYLFATCTLLSPLSLILSSISLFSALIFFFSPHSSLSVSVCISYFVSHLEFTYEGQLSLRFLSFWVWFLFLNVMIYRFFYSPTNNTVTFLFFFKLKFYIKYCKLKTSLNEMSQTQRLCILLYGQTKFHYVYITYFKYLFS